MSNTNDLTQPSASKAELEVEKLRLEVADLEIRKRKSALDEEKTSLEVQDLKKPWYRKPQYVLAALPTSLAMAGIIAGVLSGFFSKEISRLQQDRVSLEKEKQSLLEQNKTSQENLQRLDERIQQLNKDKGLASTDLQSIKDEMKGLQQQKQGLDQQVALLNTERGLNQSQLLRAQSEFTRLGTQSQALERKVVSLESSVGTADIRSLTDLWLGVAGQESETYDENEDARAQIVSLYEARPMQQRQYQSFFESYLQTTSAQPEKYVSVADLLFELTKEAKWHKDLLRLTSGFLQAVKTDRDKSNRVLHKIAESAKDWEVPFKNELQNVVFDELEKGGLSPSSKGLLVWYFVDFGSSRTPSVRTHRSDPALYLRIVKLYRDVAVEMDEPTLRQLRAYSPTAFLAVVAHLLQNQKPLELKTYYRRQPRSPRAFALFEVPETADAAEWKAWSEKPKIKQLIKLWFEDDFKTFKDNPEVLTALIDRGELP